MHIVHGNPSSASGVIPNIWASSSDEIPNIWEESEGSEDSCEMRLGDSAASSSMAVTPQRRIQRGRSRSAAKESMRREQPPSKEDYKVEAGSDDSHDELETFGLADAEFDIENPWDEFYRGIIDESDTEECLRTGGCFDSDTEEAENPIQKEEWFDFCDGCEDYYPHPSSVACDTCNAREVCDKCGVCKTCAVSKQRCSRCGKLNFECSPGGMCSTPYFHSIAAKQARAPLILPFNAWQDSVKWAKQIAEESANKKSGRRHRGGKRPPPWKK